MKGKDLHDYKIPNNPDNNDWHNLSLEDIGLYWDLPNFDECKFYYFRAVAISADKPGAMLEFETPCIADSPDEVIENYYGWRWAENTHQAFMMGFGGVSLLSSAVMVTAFGLM